MDDSSSDRFEQVLKDVVPPTVFVERGRPLLYRISLRPDLAVPGDVKRPVRGKNAFQTDLLLSESRDGSGTIPRVVFEMKTSVTTHSVLTYAAKARQHKGVYPWLRYGLVAMGEAGLQGRLFAHREGLDFMFAAHGISDEELKRKTANLVRTELDSSHLLERIAQGKAKTATLFQLSPELS